MEHFSNTLSQLADESSTNNSHYGYRSMLLFVNVLLFYDNRDQTGAKRAHFFPGPLIGQLQRVGPGLLRRIKLHFRSRRSRLPFRRIVRDGKRAANLGQALIHPACDNRYPLKTGTGIGA